MCCASRTIDRPEPAEGEVLVRVQCHLGQPDRLEVQARADAQGAAGGARQRRLRASSRSPARKASARAKRCSGSSAPAPTPSSASACRRRSRTSPTHLSHEQAAALPVAALTAWQALFDRGNLEAGQTVLITGAPAGSGTSPCSWPPGAGAKVIGTGSRAQPRVRARPRRRRVHRLHQQDLASAVDRTSTSCSTRSAATTTAEAARRRSARAGGWS